MANTEVTYSRSGSAFAHELKSVAVANLGSIDTTAEIDLSKAGLFVASSVSGTITLTLANLPVGSEATLLLTAAATAPTVTFEGVDTWLGAAAAPTFVDEKLTKIHVINDGSAVVGTYVVEYSA